MVASRARAFAKHILTRHFTGRIAFEGGISPEPVSRVFGIDRGTPIDRVLMERFLSSHRALIGGACLEIEDATYTEKFASEQHVANVLKFQKSAHPGRWNELVADLTHPETVPDSYFDTFICTQTLNFIFDIGPVVDSIHRLLVPGGRAFITAAGISQISRYDHDRWGDYWRFTDQSMRLLLERKFSPENVDICTYGNAALSCLFMQGVSYEDLPDKKIMDHLDSDYQMLVCAVVRK